MLKKVCVTAVSFALYAASCLGQANSNDGLSQLCEVYRHATIILNNVKSVDESVSALDTL